MEQIAADKKRAVDRVTSLVTNTVNQVKLLLSVSEEDLDSASITTTNSEMSKECTDITNSIHNHITTLTKIISSETYIPAENLVNLSALLNGITGLVARKTAVVSHLHVTEQQQPTATPDTSDATTISTTDTKQATEWNHQLTTTRESISKLNAEISAVQYQLTVLQTVTENQLAGGKKKTPSKKAIESHEVLTAQLSALTTKHSELQTTQTDLETKVQSISSGSVSGNTTNTSSPYNQEITKLSKVAKLLSTLIYNLSNTPTTTKNILFDSHLSGNIHSAVAKQQQLEAEQWQLSLLESLRNLCHKLSQQRDELKLVFNIVSSRDTTSTAPNGCEMTTSPTRSAANAKKLTNLQDSLSSNKALLATMLERGTALQTGVVTSPFSNDNSDLSTPRKNSLAGKMLFTSPVSSHSSGRGLFNTTKSNGTIATTADQINSAIYDLLSLCTAMESEVQQVHTAAASKEQEHQSMLKELNELYTFLDAQNAKLTAVFIAHKLAVVPVSAAQGLLGVKRAAKKHNEVYLSTFITAFEKMKLLSMQ